MTLLRPEKKPTAEMTRSELVAVLQRFNPFGSYCEKPCRHPGHATEAYRYTVAKLRKEI